MPRDAEGPVGNADDSKRGRGLSGRKSDNKAQSPKSGDGKASRSNDETDTDGYSVGGGTR